MSSWALRRGAANSASPPPPAAGRSDAPLLARLDELATWLELERDHLSPEQQRWLAGWLAAAHPPSATLDRLRELAPRATAGPWLVGTFFGGGAYLYREADPARGLARVGRLLTVFGDNAETDAAFVAAARATLPGGR